MIAERITGAKAGDLVVVKARAIGKLKAITVGMSGRSGHISARSLTLFLVGSSVKSLGDPPAAIKVRNRFSSQQTPYDSKGHNQHFFCPCVCATMRGFAGCLGKGAMPFPPTLQRCQFIFSTLGYGKDTWLEGNTPTSKSKAGHWNS